jgi:uncharacterized protein
MSQTMRPIPKVSPESLPFWEGCRRGELRLQVCRKCSKINWFPRAFCFNCENDAFDWVVASGKATLETYSIVYRPMSEAWASETPYTLAIVWLEEGIRMVTRLIHPHDAKPIIGESLRVSFVAIAEEFRLPYFQAITCHG